MPHFHLPSSLRSHSSSSSHASSSLPSSPKLETLSLTRPSRPANSDSGASTNTNNGQPISILRTSTVSSTASSSTTDTTTSSSVSGGGGSRTPTTPATSEAGGSSSKHRPSSGSRSASVLSSEDSGELSCQGLKGMACTYAIVALSRHNVLQFINIPNSLHRPILDAVQDSWPQGIVSHGSPKDCLSAKSASGATPLGGGMLASEIWEVHMKGSVWGARGTKAGVAVRRLISMLLWTLRKNGWALCASVDASSKDSSKDTLYLRREDPSEAEIPTQFFSMSFQDEDKIWLIDAPQAVIESVEDHVKYAWPQGLRHSQTLPKEPGCHELKLKGSPWSSHSHQGQVSARLLHLHLLRAVYVKGFALKSAVALADKDEGEMDSLFFETRLGKE